MRDNSIPTASAMSRYFHCPASFRLNCSEIPNSSFQAKEGTFLHSVCEKVLRKTVSVSDFDLTDEQRTSVIFCINSISNLLNELSKTCDYELILEQRIISKNGLFSGQADVAILTDDGRMYIYDFKFGRGKVESAEENLQLATLAVLAFESFGSIVKKITVGIIQPRALNKEERIISAYYDKADLLLAQNHINRVCEKALNSSNEQSCGYWCKYCPSVYRCNKVAEELGNIRDVAIGTVNNSITCENAKKLFIQAKQVSGFCNDILNSIKQFVHENPSENMGLEISNNVLKIKQEKIKIW